MLNETDRRRKMRRWRIITSFVFGALLFVPLVDLSEASKEKLRSKADIGAGSRSRNGKDLREQQLRTSFKEKVPATEKQRECGEGN